jgi:threonine dehydrogenase-like Zn-dependent dehydrogenase
MSGAQAPYARVPLADGTLLPTAEMPSDELVLQRKINPGKMFDLELPLADVAEGYRAMDQRRAIKTLLRV